MARIFRFKPDAPARQDFLDILSKAMGRIRACSGRARTHFQIILAKECTLAAIFIGEAPPGLVHSHDDAAVIDNADTGSQGVEHCPGELTFR